MSFFSSRYIDNRKKSYSQTRAYCNPLQGTRPQPGTSSNHPKVSRTARHSMPLRPSTSGRPRQDTAQRHEPAGNHEIGPRHRRPQQERPSALFAYHPAIVPQPASTFAHSATAASPRRRYLLQRLPKRRLARAPDVRLARRVDDVVHRQRRRRARVAAARRRAGRLGREPGTRRCRSGRGSAPLGTFSRGTRRSRGSR